MAETLRLEALCRTLPLRAEEAVALVQVIGRRLLRLELDEDGDIIHPTLAALSVTGAGDVTWCGGDCGATSESTARLAELLVRLYDPTGVSEDRPLPAPIARAISWATAHETGGTRTLAEFLRGLDHCGPADCTATIRGLIARWEETSAACEELEEAEEYEIDIDEYCRQRDFGVPDEDAAEGPVPAAWMPDAAVTAGTGRPGDWRVAVPAIAAAALMVTGAPQMLPSPADAGMTMATVYHAPGPMDTPARRGHIELPPPVEPPSAPAASLPAARRAAAAPVGAVAQSGPVASPAVRPVPASSPMLAQPAPAPLSQRVETPITVDDEEEGRNPVMRLLAGDGRHKVRPFPRPGRM